MRTLPSLPKTTKLGLRASTHEFCRDTIQSIAAIQMSKLEIFNKFLKAKCGLLQEHEATEDHRQDKDLHLLVDISSRNASGTHREDQGES